MHSLLTLPIQPDGVTNLAFAKVVTYVNRWMGMGTRGECFVSTACLKKVAGRSYKQAVSSLVEEGYIEQTKEHSAKDGLCAEYKLVKAFDFIVAKLSKFEKTSLKKAMAKNEDLALTVEMAQGRAQSVFTRNTKKLVRSLQKSVKQSVEASLGRMAKGNMFVAQPLEGGRIYTDFNSLPKEIRAGIRLDGKKTVEVDISACQPTCLAILAEDKAALELLKEGAFYEFIAKEMGVSRRKAKLAVTETLNGGKTKAGYVLREHFKHLYDCAKQLRQDGGRKGVFEATSKMEAQVMVYMVPLLLEKHGIANLGIHDAVAVPKAKAKLAIKLIKRLWLSEYGFEPHLKIG